MQFTNHISAQDALSYYAFVNLPERRLGFSCAQMRLQSMMRLLAIGRRAHHHHLLQARTHTRTHACEKYFHLHLFETRTHGRSKTQCTHTIYVCICWSAIERSAPAKYIHYAHTFIAKNHHTIHSEHNVCVLTLAGELRTVLYVLRAWARGAPA